MNWSEDLVMVGLANAAILDEQVLGILWEVRSQEDTEGRGTVGLKGSGVVLRISEPSEEPSFLMVISCWKMCRATAKLEDLECSSLAMENIA